MSEMLTLTLCFFLLCGAGTTLSALLGEKYAPTVLACVGSLAALSLCFLSAQSLLAGHSFQATLWTLPELGPLTLAMDTVSAPFLLAAGLIFLATAVFSMRYLERYRDHFSLRAFGVCYHVLLATVAAILLAGDALTFLIGWEVMSILSYLLVSCQHQRDRNPGPAYLMLAMGEAGFLAVTLALLLLARPAGGLSFHALRAAAASAGAGLRWAVFLLSFLGFGVKAGLVPVNRWLRDVYAVSPANVCALLSGVLLNLGIYGIVRVDGDLLPPASAGPGLVVLVIGTLSALVGILYANRESDLKTMLAESSIENMGVVVAGLGAGFVFFALHLPALAGIAFVAAFYQMVNHSVYKALLFFGAGAVDVATGTRDMDRLGGLIKFLPWTAALFLVGSLSIAALPPFNGFASEWLTLQALLQSATLPSAGIKVVFALSGAALALTAALAVTCFVKSFAMSFLGMPRSEHQPRHAVNVRHSMRAAMVFLAALCLLLGVFPAYVVTALNGSVARLSGANAAAALVPPFFSTSTQHPELPPEFVADFHNLGAQVGRSLLPGPGLVVLHRGGPRNPVVFAMSTSYMVVVLLLLLLATFVGFRLWLTRRRQRVRRTVWAGGLRRLLPELTYTATGFSNPVRVTFLAIFHPTEIEDSSDMVAQHFRMAIRRLVEEVHILDRLLFRPVEAGATGIARGLARMHHGRLNAYIGYVLLSLLAVLVLGRVL
jgi:hydrogenase-4 component B